MSNILIVDDHDLARRRLVSVVKEALGDCTVVEAVTLAQARAAFSADLFDLVILDLGLPDGNGEDHIPIFLAERPNAYIVIASINDESSKLLNALERGAKGYLLKEQSTQALVQSIQGIEVGTPPLAPTVTRRILEFIHTANHEHVQTDRSSETARKQEASDPEHNVDLLTDREREILVFLSKGLSRPKIGVELNISTSTVATHIASIYRKLGVASRSEAQLLAIQNGLL